METTITECIDRFVGDISALARRSAIEAVEGALNAGTPARWSRSANGEPPKSVPSTVPSTKAALPSRRGARRTRMASSEVAKHKAAVLAAAVKLKKGFSRKQIVKVTGLTRTTSRMLSLLVKEGKLSKRGDRRFTVYSVRQ